MHVALAGSVLSGPATRKDVRAAIGALKEDVAALAAVRDAVSRETTVRSRPGNGCLSLTIRAVLSGKDLTVYLLRRDGAWTTARATAPDYSPHPYSVGAGDLSFDGQRLQGRMTLQLEPDTAPAVFDVSADLKTAKPGRAVLKNPGIVPLGVGPFRADPKWIGASPPKSTLKKPTLLPLTATLIDEATAHVRNAGEAYDDIRAMALQEELGIPYELIRPKLTPYLPVWPDPLKNESSSLEDGPDPGVLDADELGLEADDGEDAEAAAKEAAKYGAALTAVRGMRAHVKELLAAANANRHAEPAPTTSRKPCEDPDFGSPTWSTPLPMAKSGAFRLPDGVDENGRIEWMHVPLWRCMGPVPHPLWPAYCRRLPELVPVADVRYEVDPKRLPWQFAGRSSFYGSARRTWEPQEAGPRHPLIFVPKACQHAYPMPGAEWGGFYCVADVESTADRELWASVTTTYGVALRVNNQLLLHTDTRGLDTGSGAKDHMFRLPLKKGRNRLMLLALQAGPYQRTGLALCVSGGPKSRDEAAKIAAVRKAAYAETKSPYEGTMQWRNHADGRFPDADPVLAWDFEKKMNVRWFAKLGRTAPGSLVVAGNRVLATEEPNVVTCLDRATGKLLWRRRLALLEMKKPAAWAKAEPLFTELDALPAGNEAAEKKKEIREKLAAIYKDTGLPSMAGGGEEAWCGPAMSTPVTDGKLLWAKTKDRLACFDLAGNRKWLVDMAGGGQGQDISSPVLAGGRIICQVMAYGERMLEDADKSLLAEKGVQPQDMYYGDEKPYQGTSMRNYGRGHGRRFRLKAWNAQTGECLWQSEPYVGIKFGNRYDADGIATPVAMRLTDGKATMDVVVTGVGRVYRADDGKMLIPFCGAASKCPSPIYAGAGACLFSGDDGMGLLASAVPIRIRFVMEGRDHVRAIREWSRGIAAAYGGQVLHDGVVHSIDGGAGRLRVWTSDPETGEVLGSLDGIGRKQAGGSHQPPAVVGGKLFFIDRGDDKGGARANMCVLLAGRDPVVLARNLAPANETVNMSPAFDGNDMFVRFLSGIACLTRMDGIGERYEAETVARTVLAGLQTSPLKETEPLSIPDIDIPPATVVLNSGKVVCNWVVLGPVPAAQAAAAAKTTSFPATCNFGRMKGIPLRDLISAARNAQAEGKSNPLGDMPFGTEFELPWIHETKAGSVVFWSTHITSDREQILRLDEPNSAARIWINGKEIKHGGRVLLHHGTYRVAMRTNLDGRAGREQAVRPRFWLSNDVEQERKRADAALERVRPYLERAVKLVPKTETGRRAAERMGSPGSGPRKGRK